MSDSLEVCARAILAPGKGILAADESLPTIAKRFDSIGVSSTEALRREYRSMLFSTPDLESAISGVILFEETLGQCDDNGHRLPELLSDKGIVPGVKVDCGLKAMAGSSSEKVTEGLDGLRERLLGYRQQGARFAKWRAVFSVGGHLPTRRCIEINAHALARYAALCQEQALVPIVEPEVLMDGDHGIERCEQVTGQVWQRVFEALFEQGVKLEAMLLKPSMVTAGSGCPDPAGVEVVAERTVRLLRRHVPAAVPGVAFLSGGQSAETATAHLNAINQQGAQPWRLSFSYGRALQEPPLKLWAGKAENRVDAQRALAHRARCNGAASEGRYDPTMEQARGY